MQNATATMIDNIFNSSLSIDHDGRLFNFSSLTSYQSNHRYYDAPLDGDFSPIDGVTVINDYGSDWNKVKVITQEFKFTISRFNHFFVKMDRRSIFLSPG